MITRDFPPSGQSTLNVDAALTTVLSDLAANGSIISCQVQDGQAWLVINTSSDGRRPAHVRYRGPVGEMEHLLLALALWFKAGRVNLDLLDHLPIVSLARAEGIMQQYGHIANPDSPEWRTDPVARDERVRAILIMMLFNVVEPRGAYRLLRTDDLAAKIAAAAQPA